MKRKRPPVPARDRIVFLFDVDNTLLNNDRVTADLKHHLEKVVGLKGSRFYWKIFEGLRNKLGHADSWATTQKAESTRVEALDLWYADLPTDNHPEGSVVEFTFFWKEARRWEGRNHAVTVKSE